MRSRIAPVMAILGCLIAALPSTLTAETPPEQEAAFKALRGTASNLQKNRDGTVRFLRFSKPIVKDEHLAPIVAFKQLDYLAVVVPNVTDAGLAHVAGLTNLDTLYVSGTQLTDAGMVSLTGLAKLERLYLDDTQITDAGLKSLAGLSELKTLSLRNTAVGDVGIEAITSLSKLETLDLSGTKLTDAGLARLAELDQLGTLHIVGTAITGQGLSGLAKLEKLNTLDLSGTQVTAEHLALFAGHKSLRQLLLYETSLQRDELAVLAKKTPRLALALNPAAGAARSSFERYLDLRRSRQANAGHKAAPNSTAADEPSTEVASNLKPILPPAMDRFLQGEETPDFQRHVIPLLGRLGCNGRNCHGSFQGRGGFRLSMFGYDFATDHEEIVDSGRADTDAPEESLLLAKPTLREEHGGGERFKPDSWEHGLLLKWVRAGAPAPRQPDVKLVSLDVSPAELVFERAGQTAQLKVTAVWSNGQREDVTCLSRFQTNDDTIAEVTPNGLITAKGPGDTYVISYYDSGVFSTAVLQPVTELVGDRYPSVPTPTEIDRHVVAKLSKLGIVPSEPADDEAFLRRVSLDLAGTLPTPDEIEAFRTNTSSTKRADKIDELLERPAYVEWWTNLLCDLTGMNSQFLGSTDTNRYAADQWAQWIRRRVQDNVAWDEIAAGILLASSRRPGQSYEDYAAEQSTYSRAKNPADYTAHDNPMHNYWFRSNLGTPEDRTLSFGYVFLGVRLQCAQCHKHPFDRWSKQEFEQFTQFFTRIKHGVAPDAAASQRELKAKLGVPKKLDTAALRRQMYQRVSLEGQPIPWNEVYVEAPGNKPQLAKLLGGDELDLNSFDDPRVPLVDWLTGPNNPYFARAFVNRIWSHYFNVGIVEPADDFNMANPPSNKALLDYLAAGFVAHGYDIKWLHRTILNSRTYQLSWQPNDSNRQDERNFSHAIIRRLPAEVVVDAIVQSTAADARLTALASDTKTRKIAQHPLSIQARGIDYSLLVFGKPLRTTNCDCERQMQPSLLQSLYVRNDQELLGWLERNDGWLIQVAKQLEQNLAPEVAPATAKTPVVAASKPVEPAQADALIDAAYLRTLCRTPRQQERDRAREHLSDAENTVEGLRDLLWVLVNTQEFLTNH